MPKSWLCQHSCKYKTIKNPLSVAKVTKILGTVLVLSCLLPSCSWKYFIFRCFAELFMETVLSLSTITNWSILHDTQKSQHSSHIAYTWHYQESFPFCRNSNKCSFIVCQVLSWYQKVVSRLLYARSGIRYQSER